MRSTLSPHVSLVISVCLATAVAAAQPKPDKQPAVNIPALIDQLTQVAESDIGYSSTITGSSFLPLDRQGHFQVGLLFQKPPAPSEAMREIVKQGAAAVPHLIAHLDDRRKTKIVVGHIASLGHDAGFGGIFYGNEFDYNERTTKTPPLARQEGDEEDGLDQLFGRQATQSHTITVGDLCFVALGQIVNRHFNAVRYQPTAIIIISSPTNSPALIAAVKQEWGQLTPERHRVSLIADFLKPDSEGRRNGACKRLAYYYPDALEPLAVQFLVQPTYNFFDVQAFVHKTLYQTKDAQKRRELFEAYLAKKGRPAREGILGQLFKDLDTLEAHEQHRLFPPLTQFSTQPRELLIELYGYQKDVRSSQRLRYLDALAATDKARLIDEGLIYDHTIKIDRAVRDVLTATQQDDYLARACMKRLLGRGYDAEIEKYCRRRIPQLEGGDRKELEEMLERLGWNLVHVAVERHDVDGLRALIATGANLQAKARNGMTPLHLAAASGDRGSLQLLLDAKVALDPKNARGETPLQLATHADQDETARLLIEKGCAIPDLLTAAVAGQRERAAALLAQDAARIGTTTASERTPLHLAARWGHASVAELLLDRGAAENAKDKEGWTPLLVAIAWKHESVARVLLAHKADVKAQLPYNGPQPLHLAVQTGDAQLVKLLLAHKADVQARAGELYATPLHFAVAKGEPDIAALLLDAGAAIEVKDEKGRTSLHLAAELGRADMARVLLKYKADVAARVQNKEGYAGYQPLHLAAAQGHVAVMEVLLDHKADVRAITKSDECLPLHLAAQAGHIEAARCLLKHGADLNACVEPPFTPLYFAAQSGQTDMIRFLLANKGMIQDSPRDLWGPLPMAASLGHRETVRLLLERKPDLSVRDKQGALHFGLAFDDPALITLLLDHGASADAANENGETPLHEVAQGRNVRVARVLLDHKANIRAVRKGTGAEPLHEAAAHGSPKMVALLLDRGADINSRQQSDGRTALHRAIEAEEEGRSRRAVLDLLLKRKADCSIKDKGGLTPLALAVKKKRTETVHLLRKYGVKE
jgi:ankyrin repeat protein